MCWFCASTRSLGERETQRDYRISDTERKAQSVLSQPFSAPLEEKDVFGFDVAMYHAQTVYMTARQRRIAVLIW